MARRSHKVRRHVQCTTLLAVGEGAHDAAFLNHMKSLYDTRDSGQKLTIKAADGGSPLSIFKTVHSKYRNIDYDRTIILLDGDIPVDESARHYASKHKMEWVLSTPLCLEGMLLRVLQLPVPPASVECKKRLHPQLDGPPTDAASYSTLFNRDCLDGTDHATLVYLREAFIKPT